MNRLVEENSKLKKMSLKYAERNQELEKKLKRAEEEVKMLREEMKTYAEFEELIQKITRPIIDEVVDQFQNVWAQRIAMQVELNVIRKLSEKSQE